MHNHSCICENEVNLHVNEIHFHMKGWAPRSALRKRLNVIQKYMAYLEKGHFRYIKIQLDIEA